MDPVNILSVAAATGQFAELSFKITKRIAQYAARSIELPPEIMTINHRLKALQGCISNIEQRLRDAQQDSSIDQSRLDALSSFIKDVAKRCGNLDSLLGRYLPDESETGLERVKKGFQSLSKDNDIKALSDGMAQDPVILMLNLATLDSPESKRNHRQPAAGKVITLVPTDRRVYNPVIRQDVIDQLGRAFTTSDQDEPHVVVLQGMGGQGKTQLALEYCRQSKRDVRFNGIFWVDCADESLASNTFAEIARKLTTNEVPVDNSACVRFVKETLESWTMPWLLVVDNYDDPKSYAIKKYLPASTLGRVLITSRSQALSPLGRLVEIQGMTLEESLRLLFSQCLIERNAAAEKHATAIVERLGFLPLAIAQAGAYLAEVRDTMKIDEFLELYEARMKEVLSTTPEVWVYIDQAKSPMQQDQVKNVFTTWEFSMQLLDRGQQAEEKKSFLSILAFFDTSNISETLFELYARQLKSDRPPWLELFEENGSWSTRRYAAVMTELKKLSLISSNVRNEHDGKVHVSLHPLVRDWILLRSGQDAHMRAGFATASQVLGYTLFARRRSDDIMGDVLFDVDNALKQELTSHMLKWAKRQEENLSTGSFQVLGFDARQTPITLQWVLDEYSDKFVPLPTDLSATTWAWEHCKSTNMPWPMIRCLAGIRLCKEHATTTGSEVSPVETETVREAIEITTQKHDDSIKEFALFTLASRLAEKPNPENNRESRRIFQYLICNASTPSRKCLYWASQGKLLRSTGSDSDTRVANDLFLSMYEESERSELGGPAYRFSHWPRSVWLMSLSLMSQSVAEDSRHFPREQWAREFSNKIKASSSGTTDQELGVATVSGKILLARVLIQHRKYEEAAKELSGCISICERRSDVFGYRLKVDAIIDLADLFRKSGQPKKSLCLYLRAIKDMNPLARYPDAALQRIGRDSIRDAAYKLVLSYQALGDREGVVFAAHTFAEASDTQKAPTTKEILNHQTVHALAAWGKGLGPVATEAAKSAVDEVCGHLDEVLSDVVLLEQRRRLLNDDKGTFKIPSGPQKTTHISKGSDLVVDDSDMHSGHTTFHTHILKACHLALYGFSTRAIESLQASKACLECYSSLKAQKLPEYFAHVCVMLSKLRSNSGNEDTASVTRDTIAWTCVQARKFMGDGTETKAMIRKGVTQSPWGKNLVDYLPVGEPYVEGLREEYLEKKRKELQPSSTTQSLPANPVVESPRRSVRAAVRGFFRRHDQGQQASGSSGIKVEAG